MAGNELIPDLNQTIVNAVNARIEAELLKALSGDELFASLITAALQQVVEVPRRGSSYDKDRVPYLTAVLRNVIQEGAKKAVQELVMDEADAIKDQVKKALRRNLDSIAEGLTKNLVDAARRGYGIDVNVELKVRD